MHIMTEVRESGHSIAAKRRQVSDIFQHLPASFARLLLVLFSIFLLPAQAWAGSPGCIAINADWNNRSGTFDAFYPSDQFQAADQVSFSLVDNPPSLFLMQGGFGSYVEYDSGYYLIGGSSTTVSGAQLTSGGLEIASANLSVTVTCTSSPSITAQPSNATIAAGGNTTFSATASDATSYQWQENTGSGFANVTNGGVYSGATTATLTITGATAGMNGYLYRLVASGSATPAATSNSATLTVNSPPAITTQPSNATIGAGANTTFTVTASNATGYQWQVDTGAGFSNVTNGGVYSGATTATLTITGATAGMNGYVYRVVASGSVAPAATSNSAALTVNSPPAITAQPSSATIVAGGNTSFTVTASNATGYQWQENTGAGFVNVTNGGVYSGATAATLTITGATAAMNGYAYRVVASGSVAPAAASSSATLTVSLPSPTISLTASQATPTLGASVTFTATLAGGASPTGTVTFKDGATTLGSSTVSGSTATFTTAALTVGTHSITAVYGGDANNTAVTSSATSVTVTVPTITVAPTSLSNGTVGVAYSATLSASGGTASYTFAVTSGAVPTGMSLSTAGVLSGTPTAAGSFNFTVTATDSGAYTGSRAYTLTVAAPTISISPTTLPAATVGATYTPQTFSVTGGTAPYTFAFSGILPPGLDFDTATGVVSGTPTTQSHYSFTVEVTDSSTGTGPFSYQTTASINITNPVVVLLPADGTTLTAGQVGQPYSDTSISATGGSGTMEYSVDNPADLPDGLSIDASSGAITGTPTQAGTFTFTVWAAGTMGGAESAEYTIVIGQASPTIAVSASDTAPTLGASVTFTATLSGSASPTGTVTFKDGATTLGTGTISGTTASFSTAALTVGAHSVTAVYGGDSNNATATSAALTVNVSAVAVFTFTPAGGALGTAMAGEDYSQSISATGGTGALTYGLASGALPAGVVLNASTGELTGPLDANAAVKDYSFTIEVRDGNGATGTASYSLKVTERLVAVTDKAIDISAGGAPPNVNLANGATGGPFTGADVIFVQPANAGTASIVRGEFAQASGPTPLGWYLKFIPNPAFSGTAKVGFKLTSALGVSNTGTVTYKLGYAPAEVAEAIDGLVHDFVQTRQNMIASMIKVPGLLERRQAEHAADSVTARMMPSEKGMTASFSTSLAQMESARDSADGVAGGYSLPFNIWIDGTLMTHNRDENGGKWGGFGMLSLGADYLLSEKALIGLSFHYDRMTDPTDEDAELTGNGWLAGPYASLEIGKGVFWDSSLFYGGSGNDIDTAFWDGSFDTKRWLIDTAINGAWQLDEVTVLTPQLRAVYFNEKVEDYAVSNATGDVIDIDGFEEEQFRVSLGAEIARSFTLESGSMLTPKLGVTGGYAGLDGSGAYALLTAGLTLETASFWMLESSLLFNVEGDGQKSVGGRARAAKQF